MPDSADLPVVHGLEFRSLLILALLKRGAPMHVRELAEAVEREGFAPPGRPGKAVSDALRWEMNLGRARRLGRGTYVAGHVANVTRQRMLARVARMRSRGVHPGRKPGRDRAA